MGASPSICLGSRTMMSTRKLTCMVVALLLGGRLFIPAQEPSASPGMRKGAAVTEPSPSASRPDSDTPAPVTRAGFVPMQHEKKLVEKFDEDGDGRLNAVERKTAREFPAKARVERVGTRGSSAIVGASRAALGGAKAKQPALEFPPRLTPAEVKWYPAMPLYDSQIVRTLFLDFESSDWEEELVYFNNTDVEVPAKLTVDGHTYESVGVHFRGMSSFVMAGEGRKRSLNLSLDFVHKDQRCGGYRTINLLNSAGDPTLLRTVLYSQIAREYIPAPKANWVRVVINGEKWGIYVNVQQFNKDFIGEWFGTKDGARWKAPGSPAGEAGLEYLGEDVPEYRRRFEIKSADDTGSWAALIELCRVLNTTPAEQLQEKLSPILDLDGTLRFLALENVFINTDGYWSRASDFLLYRDVKGRFHILPYDTNETFSETVHRSAAPRSDRQDSTGVYVLPDNPREESSGAGGVQLDPLAGTRDPKKPLLSKLLAVPVLRARYLGFVREIAEEWCDWNRVGPIARQYHALIADGVKADTHKLGSFEAFMKGLGEDSEAEPLPGRHPIISLKRFVQERRGFLLTHPAIRHPAGSTETSNQ